MKRLESVDVLRGGVMVVMALDHVRDFFGSAGNPTDPTTTTAALFLTRWVTHICAPTFFLLMGAGAFLAGRTKPAGELSRYLLWRGVWLIALEIVVVRCLGLQFNVDYRTTMVNVLWALGWSMIALAGLVHLPPVAVGMAGVATIVAHNLFDGVPASTFGMFAPLWTVLHGQGVIVSSPRFVVFAAYPLIPWVGVAAAGYALAGVFTWPAPRRVAALWRLGLGCALAFVVLRALNVYGDPVPWAGRTIRDADGPVVSEHDEVPAVAAVPPDDPRSCALHPRRTGWTHAGSSAAAADVWPGAPVLLSGAPDGDSSARGGRLLSAVRRRALDVRVAAPRSVSVHAAAGVGIQFADGLSDLGGRRRGDVSAMRARRATAGAAPVPIRARRGRS